MKGLVVFYSKTGNARWVAQIIATQDGGDICEVFENRRSRILDLLKTELNSVRGKEAKLKSTRRSLADYDLIIVGTPVWANRPTPAIIKYLQKNNLTGKNVAVFFTQGNKKPQAIEETKALMPKSNYLGELAVVNPLANKDESEKQIIEWCKKLYG